MLDMTTRRFYSQERDIEVTFTELEEGTYKESLWMKKEDGWIHAHDTWGLDLENVLSYIETLLAVGCTELEA